MNYTFFILIIFVFLIPFSVNKKIYSFDKPDFKISKIINILWCIFLIWFVSINKNTVKTLLFDFDTFKTDYLSSVGIISGFVIFSTELLEIFLNLYLLIVVFFLVRRDRKYRQRLIYLIPLLFIVNTIESYRVLLINFENQISILQNLIFPIIIPLFVFIPLFLTYNSRTFKKMMFLDRKEIRKIIENE